MKYAKKLFIIPITILIIYCIYSPLFALTYKSSNYALKDIRVVVSSGKAGSLNYSLKELNAGNIIGGKSDSANYTMRATTVTRSNSQLSISLNPSTWLLSALSPGSSKITGNNEKIVVLNNGNANEDLSLRVTDVAGTWSAAEATGGNGVNRYVMSGIFTETAITEIGDGDFNESGSEDMISEGASQLSSDTKFATTVAAKNGIGVMPGEERALWLKFDAPTVDTTGSEHDIWVVIEAELAE